VLYQNNATRVERLLKLKKNKYQFSVEAFYNTGRLNEKMSNAK
jgi:hypothetical protein